MIIYFINLSLVLIFGAFLLILFKGEQTKKIFFVLVIIQLSLIVGLRAYSVGWDTRNYVGFFLEASEYNFFFIFTNDVVLEKGYVFFEFIVSKISLNPTFLFIVIAAFYMISVGLFIYKNSSNPLMSFIVFISMGFFTFSMTALRQTIALGFVLLSYEYMKEKRFLPFLLLVLIASTFHYSALVFIPFYIIANIKINRLYIFFTLFSIPIIFVFKSQIFEILKMISGYDYEGIGVEGPTTLFTLLILVFITGFVQKNQITEKSNRNVIYFHATYLAIVSAIFAFIHPAVLRVGYYFMIFLVIFIPEIVLSIKAKYIKQLIYVSIIFILIFLHLRSMASPFVPYKFFWE